MNRIRKVLYSGLIALLLAGSARSETYQVFSSDRFSFRYPSDWEVGLPQMPRTLALVRSVQEKTGYAASCSVNISEPLKSVESFTQKQINLANPRIHDHKFFSKLKDAMDDVSILAVNTNTYLSNQPASSVEYTATMKSHIGMEENHFFQILTIKKPHRYVVTCRSGKSDFLAAKQSFDLIISTFLIPI